MSKPDLTPRALTPQMPGKPKTPTKKTWQKKVGLGVLLAGVLAGLGILLFTTLSGASLFFLDVDEAVQRREELGSERFRVQGITVPDTINRSADVQDFATGERVTAVTFSIAFNGEIADVVHRGGLADIFQDCLPVILEGRWINRGVDDSVDRNDKQYYFASSEMLVKHDNNYIPPDSPTTEENTYSQENPDRIDSAVGAEVNDPLGRCPQT